MTSNGAGETLAHERVSMAVQKLAVADGELADVIATLTAVVAEEATQNAGFRARLSEVLHADRGLKATAAQATEDAPKPTASPKARPRRGRRAPGPWDPFKVYAEFGEAGLRERLSELELEQLRDIIAEHGMNHDGLAMRWKAPSKVVGRIVDRVVARSTKGDAFRDA